MSDESKHQRLMSLLLRHRHRVHAFIFTLLPNRDDAEDLLQEASVVMWEKFDDFDLDDPESDFVAWANQIAYFCVKNHRRKRSRNKLVYDDSLFDDLADTAAAVVDATDARHDVLKSCLGELPDRDRTMILERYAPGGTVQQAADAVQRTLTATYKSLTRVRRALAECIDRRLTAEGT